MKTLETERLNLRNWQETDLEDFYEYAKVQGVGEMAGWPHHTSKELSKRILNSFIKAGDVYALALKENNKVIGSLGIHKVDGEKHPEYGEQREIGYVLSKDYWGKGLVVEAVKAAMEYAFEELGVETLWCGHFDVNSQSRRVVQKVGFKLYGDEIYQSNPLGKTFVGKKYLLTREDYYWRGNNE